MIRLRRARATAALAASTVAAAGVLASGSVPALAAVSTSNLLQGDTASLLDSVGNWVGTNATVTAASGVLSVVATGGNAVVDSGSGTSTWTPVTPGAVLDASEQLLPAATPRAAQVGFTFYTASGQQVTGLLGTARFEQATPVALTASALVPPTAAYVAMATIWWNTAPGELHQLTSPRLTQTSGGPAPVIGPLHTTGNAIVEADGNAVTLRGIHRDGLENLTNVEMTQQEVNELHAWGANIVRLPLNEAEWLRYRGNCYYNAGYVSQVDAAVKMVTGDGMVALLDLHHNTISPCGTLGQQPMADSESVPFWQSVAARYASNPLVAFDLYNEPHDISDSVWLNGGSVRWDDSSFQAAGMQQLYNAVRSTGARNLVFVSGTNWASTFPSTGSQLAGNNIVWAVHAYTCPNATPANGGTCNDGPAGPEDPSGILGNFLTADQSRPVVVTEFGWPDSTDGQYDTNVISYAEAQHWGWIAFAWDGTTTGTFDLLRDLTLYEPSGAGMAILTGLERN